MQLFLRVVGNLDTFSKFLFWEFHHFLMFEGIASNLTAVCITAFNSPFEYSCCSVMNTHTENCGITSNAIQGSLVLGLGKFLVLAGRMPGGDT